MSSDQERLSRDDVFDLLSSARRRYVLYYLRQHDGQATINDLATHLAAWENDADPEELTSQDEKRVYVSLYQTHVPKLEDMGVVEYDGDTSEVTLTGRAYDLDRYLTTDERQPFPWQVYYLVLAIGSALFFGLVAIEAPLLGVVSPVVAGAVVVTLFGVSAIAQILLQRSHPRSLPAELGIDE